MMTAQQDEWPEGKLFLLAKDRELGQATSLNLLLPNCTGSELRQTASNCACPPKHSCMTLQPRHRFSQVMRRHRHNCNRMHRQCLMPNSMMIQD